MSEPAPATCPIPRRRKGLTRLEWGELSLIVVALPATFFLAADLSWTPRFGALLAYCAAVVLGQGLIRDLVRLGIEGRKEPTNTMMCLCAESSIGVAVLAAGAGLLLLGIEDTITLSAGGLTCLLAGILLGGFVAKDYVFIVRKETDHGSVLIG